MPHGPLGDPHRGSRSGSRPTKEVRKHLEEASVDSCFRPELWPQLVGFAEILPDGDILPVRAKYQGHEWNVGVNRLSSERSLWYAIPELVASKLLTAKAPKIRRAFRRVPRGRQPQLRPIWLRGEVEVDPRRENLFRTVIEARHRVRTHEQLPAEDRERTQAFLEVFVNSGSYGVFVEMNRKEGRPLDVDVFGREGRFGFRTDAPEDPGAYAFPPVGAIIPAAARLMLALLERCVTDAGAIYAFCDTASMAIVASREGGWVACPGGTYRCESGEAIRALSWSDVDAIVSRFEALNPYDREIVPGSILRIASSLEWDVLSAGGRLSSTRACT